MSKDAYRSLIRDFTRIVALPDHFETIHESGGLTLDGVALTIASAPHDSKFVQVHVDFGAPPAERAFEVLRRLLEINLLLAAQGSPRLALDPATGRVIFAYTTLLQDLTAETLLGGIAMAVRQAHAWRKSFFLDDACDAAICPSPVDLSHALHV